MAENSTPNPASGDSGTKIQATQTATDSQDKDKQKAADAAQKASVKAQDARNEAEDAKLSPEERKARELEAKAGLAKSKAAVAGDTGPVEADTVKSANMLEMGDNVHPEMSAADPRAQKMGNDPANPKPAAHIPPDYDGPMVRLTMKTPDLDRLREIDVHPDMAGDYERAGWNR